MLLSELGIGESGLITKVKGRGAFRKRINEMGFVRGRQVKHVRGAPLNDPIEYSILGYEVSLRKSESQLIEIASWKEIELNVNGFVINNKQNVEELLVRKAREKGRIINVALVGNPNSGKTTLFNFASNSREHVGNYSGVTVDSKTAEFKHKGFTFHITDLPGTYSLTAYSPEELFVRKFIQEQMPDVVINVIDASNLERNLYLTTQLIDIDTKVVVALNMFDELKNHGDQFNYQLLGEMIGIPFIPTVSSKGIGIRELFDKVVNLYNDKDTTYRHVHVNYSEEFEESIKRIQILIKENPDITTRFSSRFISIKLLEKDDGIDSIINTCNNYTHIKTLVEKEIKRLELIYKDDTEAVITDLRYGFISGALKETYLQGVKNRRATTDFLDSVLTHKITGFPIFIAFLWMMFQATFRLGEYPKQWLEMLVASFGKIVDSILPSGYLNDLITDGIISGVGGVIVFLPNILLLFLFISFMEDTGYMSRVAFIMDKLMHKIGLHGKSFIPLIMGFGCNVPAIMSTRTIENRNNRILTILINPFMSCSARLPVYILFISAFFPQRAGTVLFIIYSVGILVGILVAVLFKKTLFKADEIPFVMELPPYRIPTLRSTLKHMWHKGEQYLKKMGGVILVASVIIWALGYFPKNVKYSGVFNRQSEEVKIKYDNTINKETDEIKKDYLFSEKKKEMDRQDLEMKSDHQERSYIGQIGKAIEPVMKPIGFDWKMSVSLLAGIAAKEVIVSTLGVLYQANADDKTMKNNLQQRIKEQKYQKGSRKGSYIFTPLSVVSFLLFILIYFPCIAVMAAIRRETGSWKWSLFVLIYTTGLAWLLAFLTYQAGLLAGFR
jgi:ferrous iron transport protein B